MERREALQKVGLLIGGSVLGANAFLTGCKSADDTSAEGVTFSQPDIAYLDEIAETIIPATTTPGAKAAKVGAFMTVMVTDCYEEKDQKIFREGMNKINELSRKKFDKTFMNASAQQRTELLKELDKEVKDETKKQREDREQEANKQKEEEQTTERSQNSTQESEKSSLEKRQEKPKANPPRHYFRMMKELTLLGYFTSEIGQRQALRYEQVPGRYESCVPYKKGDKAWA